MAEKFVTCEIKGLAEIQKRLEELAGPAARKAMRAALTEGSAVSLKTIQEEAPKESGFMAEHFDRKFSVKGGGTQGVAYVGPQGRMYYPDRGAEMRGRHGQRLVATGKNPTAGAQIPVASVVRFHEFGTEFQQRTMFMSRAFAYSTRAALDKMIESFKKTLGL